jgi:hypothetical protein
MPSTHVVVDGSNIATEGRSSPSLAQLDDAVRQFQAEFPGTEVIVVVDATFGHRIDPSERRAFDEAVAHGELVSPPAGAVGRGDAFLLRVAERVGAQVLSNDSFQEFHGEHPWLFDPGRLIGGKPVPPAGWIFTLRNPVRGARSRAAAKAAETVEAPRVSSRAKAPGTSKSPPATKAAKPAKAVKAPKSAKTEATAAKAPEAAKASKAAKAAPPAKAVKAPKPAEAAKTATTAKKVKAAKTERAPQAAKAAKAGTSAKPVKASKGANAGTGTEAARTTKTARTAKTGTKAKPGEAAKRGEAAQPRRPAKAAEATKPSPSAGPVARGSDRAAKARHQPRRAPGRAVRDAIDVATVEATSIPSEPASASAARASRRRTGPPSAVNDPLTFLTFVSDHPLGSTVEGTVTSFVSHGAMVDVDGMQCYVPLAGLGVPPPRKAREVLERGQHRRFVLVALDPARRGAELALPAVAPASS